ncbi:hypothetical protein NIES2100_24230 [Calothrix sp. NIES-2100]|uniref:C1 family peptidase n=1 Tax=Calothrix sp. NIES-2100 TaxID=1954172 RepID=UPI000B5FEC37|nr:hypothetical protein NIES2100_24230 [Calothrix sp. NIES-2100]
MKKKGAGWIPDYPDIKDYSLSGDEIQNLANKVQSQGATASIEDLAQKIYEILGDFIDSQPQQKNQLTSLQDDLEAKILGNLRFVPVELHSVIELGMADSEVLLIKNYLQRIISTWKQFKIKYQPAITNTTFDKETKETVEKILKTQRYLHVDGFVDTDDMKALTLLAHGVDLDRDLEPFMKLMQINSEKYELELDEYKDKEQQNSFPEKEELNVICQGLLTVYLLPLIVNLREVNTLFSKLYTCYVKTPEKQKPRHRQKQQTEDVQEAVNQLKANIVQPLEKLNEAVNKISQDSDFIINLIKKFQDNLIAKDFQKNELRDFIDITDNPEGLKKKIIDPLRDLYQEYKKSNEKGYGELVEFLPKITEKLFTYLKDFERMMGLLYMAYPPDIPSKIFEKNENSISPPIPKVLVELFKRELDNYTNKKESHLLDKKEDKISLEQLIDALRDNSIPDELLELIIESLAQILMPLGQYSNLHEAVEQGFKKVLNLKQTKPNNYPGMKGLIRETIEEYNLGIARNYSLMMELNLKDLILTALEKFNTKRSDPNTANQTQINQEYLLKAVEEQKLTVTNKELGNPIHKLIKKPLFEITDMASISSWTTYREQTSSNNEQTSLQQKNILQFPLSSNIRQQIKALEKQDNSEDNSKKSIFLSLPEFVDLTYWCSPIEDQGTLNSCTAHAGVALMEYGQKKSSESYTDSSALFLYRVTRNLMQREGDSGASVRDTIKAMVAFGVCPEEHWPYNEEKFDEEPTAFCYSFAENYKTIKYFRLDYGQISRYTLLCQVKVLLASEIPCIFGFTLYNSVYDEANVLKGHIPLPNKRSKVIGGHTVVAVGYHDRKMIENENGLPSKGALLIRNSWGTRWGQGGYGWLPYDYIMEGLTADWWSILKAEWLATGSFGAGASAWNPDRGDRNGDIGKDQTDKPAKPISTD